MHAGQRLNEIKSTAVYPGGRAATAWGLCPLQGKVKLSSTPREGKTIITKISEPGDVLGLNPVVSLPYEVTAEMMEPGQANFVPRDCLLQLMKDFPEAAVRLAQQLRRNYYTA